VSGGVLGVKTRQLNGNFKYPTGVTDNQLRTLGHLGIFDAAFDERKIFRYPRLVNITNTTIALQLRVRSYLDANCAMCHRPGGAGAFFDTRFDTPLKKQNLINGPVANQLGIIGAHVVVPGDTNKSTLFRRISITGEDQMPPLARNLVDDKAVAVIGRWISSLPATTAPLPKGWSSTDIGNVGVSGNASFLNGQFNVLASGSDIWENTDAFHFARRPLAGDGSIVVRVVSIQYTDPWAKAGVMLRENDSAGSKYVFMAFTAQGGSTLQSRAVANASTASTDGPEAKPPHWLKLVRSGDLFSGYVSADGKNWLRTGSVSIPMGKTLSAGVALTAHNNFALNSTLFDSVSVVP
jgi:regulation of enolase protein 1 (concanavalin A-like superfamily)